MGETVRTVTRGRAEDSMSRRRVGTRSATVYVRRERVRLALNGAPDDLVRASLGASAPSVGAEDRRGGQDRPVHEVPALAADLTPWRASRVGRAARRASRAAPVRASVTLVEPQPTLNVVFGPARAVPRRTPWRSCPGWRRRPRAGRRAPPRCRRWSPVPALSAALARLDLAELGLGHVGAGQRVVLDVLAGQRRVLDVRARQRPVLDVLATDRDRRVRGSAQRHEQRDERDDRGR